MHTIRQAAAVFATVAGISFGAAAQEQPAQGMRPPQRVESGRRQVSLREALQLAARQGPDVAAARAQAAVVRAGVEKAWTAWQPDISASGTFDHTSAPASLNFGDLAVGLGLPRPANAPTIVIVAPNSRFGTLQIAQPLLTPQGLFLPGIANAASEAAARGADEQREQILLAVARTYLNLQGLEGLLNAAREAERVALRREQDARAQISAGTAVELALLRAQTETANARVQIANFEGNNQSLWPLLEALTGERVEPLPFGAPQEIPELRQDEAEPWENSYAVKSAAAAVSAAERSTRLDRFAWLPSV
ncbi:MAG TPA: TolC family protein, partial [Myxococcales bacterium]